jgi:hypothetical protein
MTKKFSSFEEEKPVHLQIGDFVNVRNFGSVSTPFVVGIVTDVERKVVTSHVGGVMQTFDEAQILPLSKGLELKWGKDAEGGKYFCLAADYYLKKLNLV